MEVERNGTIDKLDLYTVFRVKDGPATGRGELPLERALAAGMEVVENDELIFQVFFAEEEDARFLADVALAQLSGVNE
jgi:hypothetical protein